MTANGWLQIAWFTLAVLLVTKPLGRVPRRGVRGPRALARAGRAPHLPRCRRRSRRGPALDRATRPRCCCSALATHAAHLRRAAAAARCCRSTRSTSARCPDRQAFETAASFTTNTNWQSYAGEIDDVLPLADDASSRCTTSSRRRSAWRWPSRSSAASRGARRARSATSGSISCAARSTCCCRSRSSLALLLVPQGVIQNFTPYVDGHDARGRQADASRWGRSRPRRRSSSSAPTAAASSTPTPRIRSRTRRRWTNFLVDARDLRDPRRRSPTRSGRMVGEPAAGLGACGPRCSCSSSPASPPPTGPRRAATRSTRRAGSTSTASAPQPGGNMEGKEVRFGIANSALFATVTTDASCGAVNAMHDCFTPLGGLVPLCQHPARRGDLRRRRRRPLRHARVRGADACSSPA